MATRKYKDPLDRGVLCSDISVVCSDISLWAVWPPENIKTSPDTGVICSDIRLAGVFVSGVFCIVQLCRCRYVLHVSMYIIFYDFKNLSLYTMLQYTGSIFLGAHTAH